jgi:hypothetical protein
MPVVGRLDQFGSMIVSGEFDEVYYSAVAVGQSSFTTPGTYSWTVPDNVTTINVVVVGGGGGGAAIRAAGGGGALAYTNFIPVTPGETLTVGVGTSGLGANTPGVGLTATDGGNSYIKRGATSLIEAGGGKKGIISSLSGGQGGQVIVGTGGSGGQGGSGSGESYGGGGGGAGGYSGDGGSGGGTTGNNGLGGGGGGGSSTLFPVPGGGGGGVDIYGQGSNGLAGGSSAGGGLGGSGGQDGQNRQSLNVAGSGGDYGGGGGAARSSSNTAGSGGTGAVRIIWGLNTSRRFPVTNVRDLAGNYAKPSISGLGTYSALEFTENIGITTTLTANVFAPYDPVYDEFGGVLFGPGQGTFMRQNLSGDVIVYNEIDEIGLDPTYVSIVE